MRLPLARSWLHELGVLICLALGGNLRLVLLSIDVVTDQGRIFFIDMFKKELNVL